MATTKGSVISADYQATHEMDELSREISEYVRGLDGQIDLAKLRRFAEANDCWRAEYEQLNPGMQRMSVGNRLRAKYGRGHIFAGSTERNVQARGGPVLQCGAV